MKISLIGAGAVGAYFILGFDNADMSDREFTVIADGDRLKRLTENGIKINGKIYHPEVKRPEEAGEQDLVIVAVKGGALGEAVKLLPPLIGKDTAVISMLNGADSEEIIGGAIGSDHVLHSIILIASRRTEDGIRIDMDYKATILYGACDIPDKEKKLATVAAAFAGTDINAEESADIMTDIWTKYARNISNNLPQAVLKTPAGLYTRSDHGLFIAQKLWDEVRKLAELRGVSLPEKVGIYACADESRYSTLQDIDARRRTEVDSLCGYLLEMSKKSGIEVPYIEYTYHAIKALEEKNDGLFD